MSPVYVSITVGLLCSMGTMLGIIILYEVVRIFLEEMDKVFFEESHNTREHPLFLQRYQLL